MTNYQINKIRVIGDVSQYALEYDGKELGQFRGGAFATTRILKSAFYDSNVDVYGYCDTQPSETITRRIEGFTKSSEASDEKVLRCIVEPPSKIKNNGSSHPREEESDGQVQILVIEDLGGFVNNLKCFSLNQNNLSYCDENICIPQIILTININSPDIHKIKNKEGLWKELYQHKKKVLVIIDADHLCLEGMNISRGISWERTAQDYLAELLTNSLLKEIA